MAAANAPITMKEALTVSLIVENLSALLPVLLHIGVLRGVIRTVILLVDVVLQESSDVIDRPGCRRCRLSFCLIVVPMCLLSTVDEPWDQPELHHVHSCNNGV